MLVADRHKSVVELSQAIPGSNLKKFYVVQFETHPDGYLGPDGRFRSDWGPETRRLSDGRPGPEWHPLFVIAWKATNSVPIGGVYLWPIADIEIEGHLMRPPSAKAAIYALRPDYSLEQLSLTTEETARLFSHITDMEKRQDQRVARLVRFIEQETPVGKKNGGRSLVRM